MGGVAWSEEEDQLLRKCIEQYGEGKWHRIPLLAGINRCRKSCRLRWLNYLRPNIKRGKFTDEEVELIIKLHNLVGNRWSVIAGRLPGRTANDVKNFWHCHLSKRLNSHLIISQSNAATKNHTKNQLVTESSSFKVVEQEKQLITQNSSFRLPEHEISQINSRHDHMTNLSSIIEIVPSAHDTAYQYSNSNNNNNHNNNVGQLENDKFSGEENIILQERSNIDDIDFELDEIKITAAGDHENYYWSFDDLLYDIEQQNKAFEAKYECLLSSYRT